ncbi:MAG: methylmalonyl Co-A mutase-associated GTPase MeaB [Candidatus Eisenbacteria bacterium]
MADLGIDSLLEGVRGGDRTALARAITIVESQRAADESRAEELIARILPDTGGAHRVGISGVPGVGKSSLIEALGLHLAEQGRRVAVLAVDPSSSLSGGSILGDKARMNRLAQHPNAFIRPSPSDRTLGGVARRTREAMLLCEAAGHDVVLVETVGVGQSEARVAQMVDFFLVLLLPGGGDELQGAKRGMLELADAIAVNKADGDNLTRARATQADYAAALRYLAPSRSGWQPSALLVSAVTGQGLDELWQLIEKHRAESQSDGSGDERRRGQNRHWFWSRIEDELLQTFRRAPEVRARLEETERAVVEGRLSPTRAARDLLDLFGGPADGAQS